MSTVSVPTYDAWFAEFVRLAREQELDWLVPCDPMAKKPVFNSGVSPAEELATLRDMSEWRGCGCGGGS